MIEFMIAQVVDEAIIEEAPQEPEPVPDEKIRLPTDKKAKFITTYVENSNFANIK
jgi:hypothetical protein